MNIILNGIFPFTYTSNPPLLAVVSFLYGVLKLGKLNCTVGKELSSFVSLIARKSTCVHTNPDKVSSLFVTELMLIYDRQTFFRCLSRESFWNCFCLLNTSICSLCRDYWTLKGIPLQLPYFLRIIYSRICIIVCFLNRFMTYCI